MRRKPYGKHKLKKEYIIFDEFNNIPGGYKIDELIKVQRVLCDGEKNKIAKEMVNKPFELQDELTSARNRQKEINKILDTSGNENSKVVVEDDLEEERNESCMEL